MSTYSIGICDDNKEFAQSLAKLCEKVMVKINIPFSIKTFYCEDEFLSNLAKGCKTNLLLLDIMLGKKSGIDLARKLQDYGVEISVVLMTVDSSFLLEGYSVQPIYFLMKPIVASELEKAIKIDLKRRSQCKNIFIKCNRKNVPILVDSILYAEVIDHALTVHTRSKDYVTRLNLTQLLNDLPQSHFARCHNSYVVNLAHVSQFSRSQGVTLDCYVTLPIGRKYFEQFRSKFIEFIDEY